MLSPSLLSWVEKLKGKQMIDIFNRLPIDFATFGNHEFDFGCKTLEKRVEESNFRWLVSNLKFPEASSSFDKIKSFHIANIEGIKIGFFGLTLAFRSEMPCKQFPQVSGIKFKFNPSSPDFYKFTKGSVEIDGKHLKLKKIYKLSVTDFLIERGAIDGYNMFRGKKVDLFAPKRVKLGINIDRKQ